MTLIFSETRRVHAWAERVGFFWPPEVQDPTRGYHWGLLGKVACDSMHGTLGVARSYGFSLVVRPVVP
jgi:hypothetical protein